MKLIVSIILGEMAAPFIPHSLLLSSLPRLSFKVFSDKKHPLKRKMAKQKIPAAPSAVCWAERNFQKLLRESKFVKVPTAGGRGNPHAMNDDFILLSAQFSAVCSYVGILIPFRYM